MFQEIDQGRVKDKFVVWEVVVYLCQDGSVKGGLWGEVNFNCVIIEFGFKIVFLLSQLL